jgi:hypothetical protein
MVSQFSSVYIPSRVVRSNSCSCVYHPKNMKLNTQQTCEILHFNNTSTQKYNTTNVFFSDDVYDDELCYS